MNPASLRLERMALEDIQPARRNPKRHVLDDIKASMQRFGFVEPALLDDRTGRLVSGHGRREALLALQQEGGEPPHGVDVIGNQWMLPVLRGWASRDDTEAEALLVAVNNLPGAGGWDEPQLAAILAELAKAEALEGLGYSDEQLEALLAQAAPGDGEGSGEAPAGPSMAERFGVPPFSVLDARQGYWRARKQAWLAMGITSELGRGGELLMGSSPLGKDIDHYRNQGA